FLIANNVSARNSWSVASLGNCLIASSTLASAVAKSPRLNAARPSSKIATACSAAGSVGGSPVSSSTSSATVGSGSGCVDSIGAWMIVLVTTKGLLETNVTDGGSIQPAPTAPTVQNQGR